MKTTHKKYAIAPRKYGNPFFDRMSCPIQVLPETIWIQYKAFNGDLKDIELPVVECFARGNWIARRYSGFPVHKILKALDNRGIYASSIICTNTNWIEIVADKSYDK